MTDHPEATSDIVSPFGSRLLGPTEQPPVALRVRIQALLTVTLGTANVIGALVVLALSTLVIPGPGLTGRTKTVFAVAGATYVLAGLVLGGWWGTRRALNALRWALDQRPPTDAERVAALRVPRQLTMMQAALWGIASVLCAGLLAVTQPELLLTLPGTIAFAGTVVCANAYLLSEFALRPVAARALSQEIPQQLLRFDILVRMLLFWCLGTAVPVAGLITLALLALFRGDVPAGHLAITTIAIGAAVLVFGLLITVFSANAVVAPIRSVRDALDRVRHGDLSAEVPVYDGTELGLLQAGFNHMAQGLRERERIRDLFGRHVGHDVAATALHSNLELGGEIREVSVLFIDLADSTALAATHSPTQVVDLLNRFFAVVIDEIDTRHGLVNKFVGDAVLAIFGAPTALDDHADRALAAARAIAIRLRNEIPEAQAGIGVSAGPVVAGNVGDRRRYEYTVTGDPVNEAARLTEHAKKLPGRIVASDRVIARAASPEADRWQPAGSVTLRGRNKPTTLAIVRADT